MDSTLRLFYIAMGNGTFIEILMHICVYIYTLDDDDDDDDDLPIKKYCGCPVCYVKKPEGNR